MATLAPPLSRSLSLSLPLLQGYDNDTCRHRAAKPTPTRTELAVLWVFHHRGEIERNELGV